MYAVTRQNYWGVEEDECHMVEIVHGGLDYANPDMLCPKYSGEAQNYEDPRDAAQVALNIQTLWQKDAPGLKINVTHGATMGMTMYMEPCESTEITEWAKKAWDELPKCDQCGELLPKEYYIIFDDPDAGKFCRSYCAEKAEAEFHQANADDEYDEED